MPGTGITQLCRELRKRETRAEKKLWTFLKGRQFADFKFRRQHPFIYQTLQGVHSFFIADFYCPSANLIVELDGKIHDFQKDYDQNRDTILQQLGLVTIRIPNEELDNNLRGTLLIILEGLEKNTGNKGNR